MKNGYMVLTIHRLINVNIKRIYYLWPHMWNYFDVTNDVSALPITVRFISVYQSCCDIQRSHTSIICILLTHNICFVNFTKQMLETSVYTNVNICIDIVLLKRYQHIIRLKKLDCCAFLKTKQNLKMTTC